VLFLVRVMTQLFLYLAVKFKWLSLPEEQCEDVATRNYAIALLYGQKAYETSMSNLDFDSMWDFDDDDDDDDDEDTEYFSYENRCVCIDADDMDQIFETLATGSVTKTERVNMSRRSPVEQPPITLAVIENFYIIFWVSKDLLWSFGTGDLTNTKDIVVCCEILAMRCGFMALTSECFTAYIHRRDTGRLLDGISTIFWICANFVWMFGEFFIRYDNLEFDDSDAGDDAHTRIASGTLFGLGVLVQMYIVLNLVGRSVFTAINSHCRITGHKTAGSSSCSHIEMSNIQSPASHYQTLLTTFSPQYDVLRHFSVSSTYSNPPENDEEEEDAILYCFDR